MLLPPVAPKNLGHPSKKTRKKNTEPLRLRRTSHVTRHTSLARIPGPHALLHEHGVEAAAHQLHALAVGAFSDVHGPEPRLIPNMGVDMYVIYMYIKNDCYY